uniref:Uncharacterized protein n=1 Tax=uncultured microorganism TaxID=358574 RepID=K0J7B4_9ZZZZ|nr:hypothetical protein [uncultured microorganism]
MLDLTHLTTCLRNARVVVQDALTHVYVMSEHQADIARYNLGRGEFASSISLLATLNLLAKVHHILTRGESVIVGETRHQAFNAVKEQIQKSSDVRWAEVRQFMRKPRNGDVNESDAFASFIQACPIDFGLPHDDSGEARRIWATFRNKLTHLIALVNDVQTGQMLMGLNVQPSQPGMYERNLQSIKDRMDSHKPFSMPAEETKAVFRDKEVIPSYLKQMVLNDKCHVERLAVAVDMTIDWLIKSINDGVYTEENLGVLARWLEQELTPPDSE